MALPLRHQPSQAAKFTNERFCRMWEYYLAAVDVGFSNGGNLVFQIVLSKKIAAMPIMRDHMLHTNA